jgi:hypothetical protein
LQGPPKYIQIVIFGLKIPIPSGNPVKDETLDRANSTFLSTVVAKSRAVFSAEISNVASIIYAFQYVGITTNLPLPIDV